MAKTKVTFELDDRLRRAAKQAALNSGLKEYQVFERALKTYLGWDIMDRLRARVPELTEDEAMRLAYEEVHAQRKVGAGPKPAHSHRRSKQSPR
jgi:hypothetical protein